MCFKRRLKCHLFDAAFWTTVFPTGVSVSQPHKLFCFLWAHCCQICQDTFSSKFNHAYVTPLLKKPGRDPNVSANLRTIPNLNSIYKILERLFHARLQPYIAKSPSVIHLQSAYCKHHFTVTSPIHLFDSICLQCIQLIMCSRLFFFYLSLNLSATFYTFDHTIILNRLTSSFGITSGSSLQQVFFSHFRLLFLLHITFILWCSPMLCPRTHPFHNLCLTYSFNCILSRCQSREKCWRYTTFCLPFPCIVISSSLCSLQRCVWFKIQLKLRLFALAPAHDSNRCPIKLSSMLPIHLFYW